MARGGHDHEVGIKRRRGQVEDDPLAGPPLELIGIVVLSAPQLLVAARERAAMDDGRARLRE